MKFHVGIAVDGQYVWRLVKVMEKQEIFTKACEKFNVSPVGYALE